jgi:hypothetical protein
MEEAGQGIPAYFGGIMADVQNHRPKLVMTLVYPDCEIAETAAQMIEKRWATTMADSGPATFETATFEGVDGLCAAAVAVTAQDPEPAANPHAKATFAKFTLRAFNVLQIGNPTE